MMVVHPAFRAALRIAVPGTAEVAAPVKQPVAAEDGVWRD